jgi:predicted alpha/beta hydrolase family esterase
MKNYLIVHGAMGNPEGNWFPWLKSNLKDGQVFVPKFPTPAGQNLEAWLAVAQSILKNCLPKDTILIGHSSGALLVLRMAERAHQPFKAIFSVCPFGRDLGLAEFDPLNASFIRPAFDWQAVSRGADKITCLAGGDDPYVPLAYSKEIADALSTELIVIPKGGHLNADAGITEFPILLGRIQSIE